MNELFAILCGLIVMLLLAIPPLAIGVVIQLISRRRLGLPSQAMMAVILVAVSFWTFDWTMVRIFDSTWPSLIGSFLVAWLLIMIGASSTYGFKEAATGAQNKSGEGTA
jgi:hypothetical protein